VRRRLKVSAMSYTNPFSPTLTLLVKCHIVTNVRLDKLSTAA
jgi:hypothetical protein